MGAPDHDDLGPETPPPGRCQRVDVPPQGHLLVAHALVVRDGRYLFLRRRAGSYWGGRWDIPGGTVEPGEDPRPAARRETAEETGLEVRVTGLAGHLANRDTHGRPLCFHTLTYDVTETDTRDVVLSPSEHDEVRWLLPHAALDLDLVWHVRVTLTGRVAGGALPH